MKTLTEAVFENNVSFYLVVLECVCQTFHQCLNVTALPLFP